MCQFINVHLSSVCNVHKEKSIDHPKVKEWIRVFRSLDCGFERNPLQREKWGYSLFESADPVLSEYGYLPVEVHAPPRSVVGIARSFLFAKDQDGLEYHVSLRVADMDREDFYELESGDRLLVKPNLEAEVEEGKAIPVIDARLPD